MSLPYISPIQAYVLEKLSEIFKSIWDMITLMRPVLTYGSSSHLSATVALT
jgi:hypothetical protein